MKRLFDCNQEPFGTAVKILPWKSLSEQLKTKHHIRVPFNLVNGTAQNNSETI